MSPTTRVSASSKWYVAIGLVMGREGCTLAEARARLRAAARARGVTAVAEAERVFDENEHGWDWSCELVARHLGRPLSPDERDTIGALRRRGVLTWHWQQAVEIAAGGPATYDALAGEALRLLRAAGPS